MSLSESKGSSISSNFESVNEDSTLSSLDVTAASVNVMSDVESDDDIKNHAATTTSRRDASKRSSRFATPNESLEIPETDSESESEEEIIASRRLTSVKNRIVDTDESSDDEEKLRRSMYEAESDSEDHAPPIEDQAFSKATRRSISGLRPRPSLVPNSDESSADESDSFIVEDSRSELEEEPEQNIKNEQSQHDEPMDNSLTSLKFQDSLTEVPSADTSSETHLEENGALAATHSSTMRSPLKDVTLHRSSMSNESFNSSIGTKMSSTMSVKAEDPSIEFLDEAAGGVSISKLKVSRSLYDATAAAKEEMERQINTMVKALEMSKNLPDGGDRLRGRINVLLNEVEKKKELLDTMEVDENKSIKSEIARSFETEYENKSTVTIDDSIELIKPTFTGKVGMKNFTTQKALTVEKLADIQQSIEARPLESVLETQPKHLKIMLMNHQLHALAFMLWREKQEPRGGILADDMGLGKTLTAISLILKGIQADEQREDESDEEEEEDDDEGWKARGRKDMKNGGTLVVCPASLIKQWEAEIKTKVKRGALEIYVFHGPNREYKARKLSQYDIVLTTYQLVVTEEKNEGCLFQVKWKRIILDEGHVIRNHKSKQSEAICKLASKFRWVLTGTPIQNKEFDLYAAVKFLRCKPFDELNYWKSWIEVAKGKESSPRVQTLLKAIMLRRTKTQLIETGEIQSLPEKVYKQFDVTLNQEERLVYNKFMSVSQAIFANYVSQQQEKNDNYNKYDQNRLGRLFKKFAQRFNVDHQIKAHEILVLLMRLRQICCHPGLAKGNLDKFEVEAATQVDGDEDEENPANESDGGLLKQLENMNLEDDDEEGAATVRTFSADSDAFNMDIPSSKILAMMNVLRKHVLCTDDKAIIVSQWTSYLKIIRGMLEVEGVQYCELNGSIPVKNRNDIVVNFNKKSSPEKVMLLSLTAGGVGLNLVGANYLFLMDLHWNPQLEQQAQDRIYRFGQEKQVNVFKFVCVDTIEMQILKIQANKMDLATSSLTGAKKAPGSKLTIDDLKSLFGMA